MNTDPTATIIYPDDEASVFEGETLVVQGLLADKDDSQDDMTHAWTVNGEAVCTDSVASESGDVSCSIDVTADEPELLISLEVKDDGDGVGLATVRVTVVPTAAPVVEVTSPSADALYYSDRLVGFEGTVSDQEDSPEDLTLEWVSSLDGPLEDVSVTPNEDGTFSAFRNLSEGEHALTLTVTDTSGKTTVESFLVDVRATNSPPDCEITEPEDGGASSVGELVNFRGIATDVDVPATALAVEWSSDSDGVFATSTPSSNGDVLVSSSTLTPRTHTITMTVADEVGELCTDVIFYSVGSPPTLVVVQPEADALVNQGEDITFEATASDSEDVSTALTVTWTSSLDGELDSRNADSAGTARFTTDALSAGVHDLTVRVTDTTGQYAEYSQQLLVNGWPSTPDLLLSPEVPYTTDDLSVVVVSPSVDPEGDAVNLTWAWTKDLVAEPTYTTGDLPSSATSKGEVWRVTVTPDDGVVSGIPWEAEVTIANSLPVVADVTLVPDVADETTVLTCTEGVISDADDDAVTVAYAWTVNGVDIGVADASLDGTSFDRDDVVACSVTANDGEADGDAVWSAETVIVNALPTVASVTLDPLNPLPGDTVTCAYDGFDDADGDADASTRAWTVNGVDAGTGDTLGVDFARDDVIVCTVTPYDGFDTGTPVEASVTGGNVPPTAPVISLEPSTALTSDDLVVSIVTPSEDVDGDAISYRYSWWLEGVEQIAYMDAVLPAEATRGNETWTVRVVGWDGYDEGASVEASADVMNSAPELVGASVEPDQPTALSTFTCAYEGGDPDGDEVTESVTWYINDVEFSTAGTPPGPSDLARDDTVTCAVSVSDGEFESNAVTSAPVVIGNTPPVVSNVAIDVASPVAGELLTCTWDYSDVDGDADTSTVVWLVDGTEVLADSTTLAEGFYGGDEVTCRVTAHDGTDAGNDDSASVMVENSPPNPPEVDLIPDLATEDDNLQCTITSPATDPDLDLLNYTYRWFKDGVETDHVVPFVPSSDTARGETWRCEIFASDDEVDSVVASDLEGPLGGGCVVATVNGANGYIQVANQPSLNVGSHATFAAWVRMDRIPETTDDGAILDSALGSFDCAAYGLYVTGEDHAAPGSVMLKLDTRDGGICGVGVEATTSIPLVEPNRWSHLAATYDGTSIRFYLNGALADEFTVDTIDPGQLGGPLVFGGRDFSVDPAVVDLADVQVWDRTLSEAELYDIVLGDMPAVDQTGLVGWWLLNDGLDSAIFDRSASEAAGTLTGSAAWTEACPSEDGDGDTYPAWQDCDDDDDDVFPGASDYCKDGLDSDCSPLTPSDCNPQGDVDVDSAAQATTSGSSEVATGADLTDDGVPDVVLGIGDRLRVLPGPLFGFQSPTVNIGTYEGLSEGAWNSPNITNDANQPVYKKGHTAGTLAVASDFTGDGVPDVVAGNFTRSKICGQSIWYGANTGNFGEVGLLAGPLTDDGLLNSTYPGKTTDPLAAGEAFTLQADRSLFSAPPCGHGTTYESRTFDELAYAVVAVPDLDGDGLDEILVGAPRYQKVYDGAVFLIRSTDLAASTVETRDLVENLAHLILVGEPGEELGTSLSTADVDGDGLPDLLLGSTEQGGNGKVRVVLGRDIPSTGGSASVASLATLTFEGVAAGDMAGMGVQGLGDLDGDGDDEFAVVAPGAEGGQGVVYVVPGFYEFNKTYSLEDEFNSVVTPGARGAVRWVGGAGDALSRVVMAGDMDSDGAQDFAIAAPDSDFGATDGGAVYLVYGGTDRHGALWDASGTPAADLDLTAHSQTRHGARFYLGTGSEFLGRSLAGGADLDQDGYDDLVISAVSTTFVLMGGGT